MSINENGEMQGKDGRRLTAQNGDLSSYNSLDTAIHRVNIHMKPTGMPARYTFFSNRMYHGDLFIFAPGQRVAAFNTITAAISNIQKKLLGL